MSWLADAGVAWGARKPVCAWIDSGTSEQIEFTIPPSWDAFWDWADGATDPADQLRVTKADGQTTVGDIQVVSFTLATRTSVIRVTAQAVTSDTAHILWLYWDKAGASAVSTTVTSSSPKTGNLEDLEPVGGPVIPATQTRPGATALTDGIVKTSAGVQVVWWSLEGLLQRYATLNYGHADFEEVDFFKFEVYDSASDQTASMVDGAASRMVVVNGVTYLRTRWKADSGGDNDYNLRLTVNTTDGRVIEARALGLIQDLTE